MLFCNFFSLPNTGAGHFLPHFVGAGIIFFVQNSLAGNFCQNHSALKYNIIQLRPFKGFSIVCMCVCGGGGGGGERKPPTVERTVFTFFHLPNRSCVIFDSRMLRRNICQSLWLVERGTVKQWEMTSLLCANGA
jgi:hypothetical protein